MRLLWPGIIFPDIFALIGVTNAMAPSVGEIEGWLWEPESNEGLSDSMEKRLKTSAGGRRRKTDRGKREREFKKEV